MKAKNFDFGRFREFRAKREEDVEKLPEPDIQKSPIMRMIIDAIDYFVEQTNGEIPVCVTDTQSPIDNATLVWAMIGGRFFRGFIIRT